jgi:hypothetical protein
MGRPESLSVPSEGDSAPREELSPHHFYAAYVFDQPETRLKDIGGLIIQARQLAYPTRYCWLSEVVDLNDTPERLIACVHHPISGESAGMDLYEALQGEQITWDALEAATLEEYRQYGKPLQSAAGIYAPGGELLYPAVVELGSAALPSQGLVEADETPAVSTNFLIYYSFSGMMTAEASDARAASEVVFELLHTLVGKGESEGVTVNEARGVHFSGLLIDIDYVEALEFPHDDQT